MIRAKRAVRASDFQSNGKSNRTPPSDAQNPASPRPFVFTAGASLVVSCVLVIGETILCAQAGLPPLPVALCTLALCGCILWAASRPQNSAERAGRIVMVGILLKVLAVAVAITGGLSSPYAGMLFLPVFLGALYFRLLGGSLTGIAICIYFVSISLYASHSFLRLSLPELLTQCGVFLLVSVGAGAFAEHLQMTASTWSRRARQNAARARQAEWFIDTAVMMQSLHNIDHMLSAALLRLPELLRFDTAAVYLREPDESSMTLAQSMGPGSKRIEVRTLPGEVLEMLRKPDLPAIFVSQTVPGDPDLVNFAGVDSGARSVAVVPLRTLDDVFGVLYVASHIPGEYSERDRDNLVEYARHIVYPIQRIRLQAQATTDALTGLHNSRAFWQRLRVEVERAGRYSHSLSLIMIDIDHFKRVNDTKGHPAGDAILTQIGGILRRVTRGIDIPARYGGEEMAVLCPETTLADARLLAERIRETIARTDFALPDGSAIQITISCGVAGLEMGETRDVALVFAADAALYAAKSGGRNCVCATTNATNNLSGANLPASRVSA